ncbi:MAG: hisA/hisF family protein [Planctomycetia bacterium]|nr:hisA/hisF family protein [Planctomycetia bacterium]
MHILPAVDLRGGVVVHAVAGRRDSYRPLVSPLCANPEPASIARGLIDRLGLTTFYVADLDAIAGALPDANSYRELLQAGATLWIDAGLTDRVSAARLLALLADEAGVTGVVAGLESLAGPIALAEIVAAIGPERTIFSLDLLHGEPRTAAPEWQGRGAEGFVAEAVAAGVRRVIVLDVTAVGVDQGCPTLDLCRRLRAAYPEIELTTGGGVRGPDDLRTIATAGCNAALVATALHDGRISRFHLPDGT